MQFISQHNGKTLTLHGPAMAGGEGVVYSVREDDRIVVKLYKKAKPEKFEKLRLMLGNRPIDPSTRLKGHCGIAWPMDIIQDLSGNNAGFAMPKITAGIDLFEIYQGDSHKKFPWLSYRHQLMTAYNLCTVTAAIHEKGLVIGDLNDSNAIVQPSTLVTLIDCDSFQIDSHLCEVGRPEYLPPELQKIDLSKERRNKHSDNFALAIFIYYLLMNGVHPFAGRGGPSSLGERIVAGLYAHSSKSDGPPSFSPPLNRLPPYIQSAFSQAFEQDCAAPDKRPTSHYWRDVLHRANKDLVQCPNSPAHLFFNHLKGCPWCEKAACSKTTTTLVHKPQVSYCRVSSYSASAVNLPKKKEPPADNQTNGYLVIIGILILIRILIF